MSERFWILMLMQGLTMLFQQLFLTLYPESYEGKRSPIWNIQNSKGDLL